MAARLFKIYKPHTDFYQVDFMENGEATGGFIFPTSIYDTKEELATFLKKEGYIENKKKGVINLKMQKIKSCHSCNNHKFEWPDCKKPGRFRCYFKKNLLKNGKGRILNHKNIFISKIPGWCKLEDYPGKE